MTTSTRTRGRSGNPGEPGLEELLTHTATEPALKAAAHRLVSRQVAEPDRSTILAALGLDDLASST